MNSPYENEDHLRIDILLDIRQLLAILVEKKCSSSTAVSNIGEIADGS